MKSIHKNRYHNIHILLHCAFFLLLICYYYSFPKFQMALFSLVSYSRRSDFMAIVQIKPADSFTCSHVGFGSEILSVGRDWHGRGRHQG